MACTSNQVRQPLQCCLTISRAHVAPQSILYQEQAFFEVPSSVQESHQCREVPHQGMSVGFSHPSMSQ
jgi:hypothetical protein